MEKEQEPFHVVLKEMQSNSVFFEAYVRQHPSFLLLDTLKEEHGQLYTALQGRIKYQKLINIMIKESVETLKKQNIPFIGVKGFFLADRYYSNDTRLFNDMDILVEKKNAYQMYHCLLHMKYKLTQYTYPLYNKAFLAELGRSCYIDRVHALEFSKTLHFANQEFHTYVDLHTNCGRQSLSNFRMDLLFQDAKQVDGSLYELSVYDTVLYLIYHMMWHISYIGHTQNLISIELQKLYDIYLVLHSDPELDPSLLFQRAKLHQMVPLLVFFEYLYNSLFHDFDFEWKEHLDYLNRQSICFRWKPMLSAVLNMSAANILLGDYGEISPNINKVHTQILESGSDWKGSWLWRRTFHELERELAKKL